MGNYKVYLGLNQTIMCHVPSTSIANHAQVICTHYYWEAVVSPENFQLVLTESYSSTFSASTATRLVSSPRCWRCPPTVPWRRRKVLISIQEACQGTYMYTVRKECFTSVIMLCVYIHVPLGKVCDVLLPFTTWSGFTFDGIGSCSICAKRSSIGGALAAGARGSCFSCSNRLSACTVISLTFFLFVSLVNFFCYHNI